MSIAPLVKVILPSLAVLVSGCVGGPSGDSDADLPPPTGILSQQSVLGNRRPSNEVRPGIHFFEGKHPYVMIVLKNGNADAPDEKSTPKGPVRYDLEWRQDGERDASGELVTPSMGGTVTLRWRTPPGVPVLVRHWLRSTAQRDAHEADFGGTPYKTKRDVYEEVWVQGGKQAITWRTGP
jgi:hypothetical protein